MVTDYCTRQPTGRALLEGAAAALAGAAAQTAVAYATGYQLAVLAIGTGIATGLAVTRAAAPPAPLRAAAAAIAVAGCALGMLLGLIAILVGRYGVAPGAVAGQLGTVLRAYPGEVGRDGFLFWAAAGVTAAFPPRWPGRRVPSPARGRAAAWAGAAAPVAAGQFTAQAGAPAGGAR